jgi:hypothetical protein
MNETSSEDPRIEVFEAAIECQVEAVRELTAIVEDLIASTEEPTRTNRRIILIAGIRRTQQTAAVIADLAQKRHVEEMAILSRTVAEAAINTCYLQVCDDNEFKRFLIFDPVADLKLHQELKNAVGHVPSSEAEAVLEKMAQAALDSGLFGKRPRSWTEIRLAERARQSDLAIDSRFNQKCFQILRTSAYEHGHAFVHFTRKSLGFFGAAYQESGQFTPGQRLMQVMIMVGTANHSLMAIAMFFMSRYQLATHDEWDGVNELLQTMKIGMAAADLTPPP